MNLAVLGSIVGCGLLLLLTVRVARSPVSHKGGASWRPKSPGGREMYIPRRLKVEDYVPEDVRRSADH